MAVINMRMPELEENNGPAQLTDTAPYLYRQAPIITEKLSDKLIGGTYAFNQLWNQPNTLTAPAGVNTGSLGVAYNIPFVAGHKYLQCVKQNTTMASNTRNTLVYNDGANHFQVTSPNNHLQAGTMYWVFSASSTNTGSVWVWVHTPDVDVSYSGFGLFDLTQMFGAAIADYIYNLETATPVAGVAWFRALFPDDYYAYNPGELISVKTSAHKTVEKNLLNPLVFRGGSYNPAIGTTWNLQESEEQFAQQGDTFSISLGSWASRELIAPVIKGATYHFKFTITADTDGATTRGFLDKDFKVLSVYNQTGKTFTQDLTLTAPENGFFYFLFAPRSSAQTIVITSPQFEYGNTATDYEPYEEHVYPLDNDLELRGIPKLDANNNLYYDGDVYESNGTVTRKWKVADLGSFGWNADANRACVFYTNVADKQLGSATVTSVNGLVCAKYEYRNAGVTTSVDKYISDFPSYGGRTIHVRDTAYASASDFKTAMNGVQFIYQVETPTTENADAFTDPQDAGYTEQYIDERAVPVPVGHETTYFDMVQNVVIPMTLPMYDDGGGVVIPMALPYDTTQEE